MSGWKRAPSSLVKTATISGPARAHAGLVERLHRLEPGEHAVVAVVAAAGADGVDVGAGHHRREVVAAGAPARRPNDVADGVDADREAELAHPGGDEVTPCTVLVGEGEAAAAALAGRADRGQGVEARHQALGIQAWHRTHACTSSFGRGPAFISTSAAERPTTRP